MPLAHIHNPAEPLVIPHEVRVSPAEWAIGLRTLGAQLEIFQPGFAGDITPGCFTADPFIPDGRFRIEVGSDGEEAILRTIVPPDPDTLVEPGGQLIREDGTAEPLDNCTVFPISAREGEKSTLLAYRSSEHMHAGGMILYLAAVKIPRMQEFFAS